VKKFAKMEEWMQRYTFFGTPVYFEFLAGKRDLTCSAWAIPTRNMAGWKAPCYFMTDAAGTNGTGHYSSYAELLARSIGTSTASSMVSRKDPRCENCMTHCGYEPTASLGRMAEKGDTWKTIKFNFGARPKATGRGSEIAAFQRRHLRERAHHGQAGRSRSGSAGLLSSRPAMPPTSSNVIPLPSASPAGSSSYAPSSADLSEAISRAQENLLRQQHPDGPLVRRADRR
jgi:hypothetical protein